MAWLELHESLPTHPKTIDLAFRLGIEPHEALGHLACHWLWALSHAEDGFIPDRHVRAAMRCMGYSGDTDLATHLVESGWWDKVEGGYLIHNWMKYAGRLIERRENDRRRKAEERAKNGSASAPQPVTPSVKSSSDGHPTDTDRNLTESGVTVPYSTVTVPSGIESKKLKRELTPHLAGGERATASREWENDPAFVRFWMAYPKCPRKKAAGKAFARWQYHGIGTKVRPEVVLARLEEDKRCDDWIGYGGERINAPEVWLNGRRWEDDPEESSAAIVPATAPPAPAKVYDHPYKDRPWRAAADRFWGTPGYVDLGTGEPSDSGFVRGMAEMHRRDLYTAGRLLRDQGIDAAISYIKDGIEPAGGKPRAEE